MMILLLAVGVASSTVFAAPAVIASVFAGFAGVLVMADTTVPPPMEINGLNQSSDSKSAEASVVNVFELNGGAGVVVFRHIDGKLVSRFYRSRA